MALSKKDDSYHAAMNADDIHTILGPESSFEGKLVFASGTIRIDGNFKGEIRTENTLIIGESARVEANVAVGNVIITGEVIGDITAKRAVAIEKPGKVRGTIVTPELMIERGVVFEGTCKMETASKDSTGAASVTLLKDPTPTS